MTEKKTRIERLELAREVLKEMRERGVTIRKKKKKGVEVSYEKIKETYYSRKYKQLTHDFFDKHLGPLSKLTGLNAEEVKKYLILYDYYFKEGLYQLLENEGNLVPHADICFMNIVRFRLSPNRIRKARYNIGKYRYRDEKNRENSLELLNRVEGIAIESRNKRKVYKRKINNQEENETNKFV